MVERGRGASAWLLAALALAAALRFPGLGSVFPVDDEYYQLFAAVRPGGLLAFLRLAAENPHHVLLDPLQTFLMGRYGDSLGLLRLPSALWGTAAAYACWRLAVAGGLDRARAGLAAVLTAACLLHADWSRRADFYALLPVLPALQAAALLERRWKAYAGWTALFLYAHPYAVLTLPFPLLLRRPGDARPVLAAWAAAGLAFLPWFLHSTRLLADLSLFEVGQNPGALTLGTFLARAPLALGQVSEVGAARHWTLSLSSALSALYLAAFLASALRTGPRPPLLALARLAVPLGVAAVAALDLLYGYYFSLRQLLWLLPFYLLLVADGALLCLEALGRERWAPALAALAAALALPEHVAALRRQTAQLREFEGVVRSVDALARPDDAFAFEKDTALMAFLYHYDRRAFASVEGLELKGRGQLSYRVQAGLTARGRAVLLGDKQGAWRFSGHLHDLTVAPPPGIDVSAARPPGAKDPRPERRQAR